MPQTAEFKFRLPAKRFRALAADFVEVAAAQRDWRGFRIATCSRERDDATLPKIWTPCVVAISRRTVEASMNHTAIVRNDFRYRDLGITPTPWR